MHEQLFLISMCFSYDIEITSEVTGRAPTPELTIGVKQSG